MFTRFFYCSLVLFQVSGKLFYLNSSTFFSSPDSWALFSYYFSLSLTL